MSVPSIAEIRAAVPGLSKHGAAARRKQYRAGEISVVELFAPRTWTGRRNTRNLGTPEWQALGRRERRENLRNLPSLGTWERRATR